MKTSIRAVAVAAATLAGLMASNLAIGSTISKNVPGAIRHPVNQAAIAVGADSSNHHRTYAHTTYSNGRRYSTTHYSSGYRSSTTMTRHRRHRRHRRVTH